MSVIVMTTIGDGRHKWPNACEEIFRAPPGFCWRFVPESSLATQVRSILRIAASAVAVWVGSGEVINRAEQLVSRLLGVGIPIVIAIAEVHDPLTESVLRQTGALYVCADEAEQRLSQVLESILGSPASSHPVKQIDFTHPIKLDGS
jgi:hypothetical protein